MSFADRSKKPKSQIFLPKYRVIDIKQEMRGVFVLEPGTDPVGRLALEFYAAHVQDELKREYVESILRETARRVSRGEL
jgi:hypothetical protein